MSSPRIWFITGTSSGFGLQMARCALARGDRVVATLRKPEVLDDFAAKYTPEQLLVTRLDVTKPAEIKAAFAKAKEVFGRVDVVFNNAGYTLTGEAEGISDDVARDLFEVDFWGAAHVSQEAVRFFRDENTPQGGHLIQNTLEGFTETLSKEMDPSWNIKISSVLPGGFVTDLIQKFQMMPQHPAYVNETNPAGMLRKWFEEGRNKDIMLSRWSDPEKGVQKIYELSLLPSPPLRLLLGKDCNARITEYLEQLTREVKEYASWSDGLQFAAN